MTHIERQAIDKLSRSRLDSPLRRNTLSELFHENTKLAPLSGYAYRRAIESFVKSEKIRKLLDNPYKIYSLMDQADLPAPATGGELRETIARRRSLRSFTGEPATVAELSQMLFYSYGRTDSTSRFRAVASGGGAYPLEIYVVALRIDGLEPGIYHYGAEDHHLDVVSRGNFLPEMESLVITSGIEVENATMVVIFTALFRRSTLKYQDRGYRMVLMEAGAAAHSLSLMVNLLGFGDCYAGGFMDDALSELLGIDGVDEAPLLPVVIGRRQQDGEERPGREDGEDGEGG